MKYKYLYIIFFLMFGTKLCAQTLKIDRIEFVRDKIVVYYSLDDSNENQQYTVDLYSSKDNFATPLIKVSGDVGLEVKPGESKKIEWNILQELGSYKGNLMLEVRARVFVPVVKLTSFDLNKKYKRGKTYPLLWSSGNMGGQIDIDLFEGKNRVGSDRNIPNTGKYEWHLPGSVKPGSNYYLRFTNTRNRDEYIVTGPFRIVPRTPFVVKAGMLLLIGGGVAVLSGGSESNTPPGKTSLPSHPGSPSN